MSTMGELSCENCGVGYGADDIFCENCGYDFITGSLPSGDEGLTPPVTIASATDAPMTEAPITGEGVDAQRSASTSEAPVVGAGGEGANGNDPRPSLPRLHFAISVDRSFFDAVVSEGELEFPDPTPADTEIEVAGTELHVGRASPSRAIHPDLDISDLTGDPAVASRHAVIRVAGDGGITVSDVGSTNGTFVGAADAPAITVGEAVPVPQGSPIYVGAWTRLVVSRLM